MCLYLCLCLYSWCGVIRGCAEVVEYYSDQKKRWEKTTIRSTEGKKVKIECRDSWIMDTRKLRPFAEEEAEMAAPAESAESAGHSTHTTRTWCLRRDHEQGCRRVVEELRDCRAGLGEVRVGLWHGGGPTPVEGEVAEHVSEAADQGCLLHRFQHASRDPWCEGPRASVARPGHGFCRVVGARVWTMW